MALVGELPPGWIVSASSGGTSPENLVLSVFPLREIFWSEYVTPKSCLWIFDRFFDPFYMGI